MLKEVKIMDHLIKLLKAQLDFYNELLEIAQQKKAFIVKNDIESMKSITGRENSLIGKLQKTELELRELVLKLAKSPSASANELTLAELINNINESDEKRQLNSLRKSLRASMDEVKALNEQNQKLINQSLEYMDFILNLFRNSVSGPAFAGADEMPGQAVFQARG